MDGYKYIYILKMEMMMISDYYMESLYSEVCVVCSLVRFFSG